ncbi:MAG: acetyl-CoA hydrolase/transferase C-terminal domain-containing protein [Burkholderiaceae bacterium]
MASRETLTFGPDDAGAVARHIVDVCERNIRLALPLGLGKANTLVNSLVRLAEAEPSIELSILTALTLGPPGAGSDLERRFLAPARDRLFGAYPPLRYAELMADGRLPRNIRISEFFMQAGSRLNDAYAQRHFISANYTHALRYVRDFQPNVLAQLVAVDSAGNISLSCNTDITADLLELRRQGKMHFLFAAEGNPNLPFMEAGQAQVERNELDLLLHPADPAFELFSAVRRPVSPQDMAIGLHVSRLIRDGGTLQVGIGSIGDAIAHALILRDRRNDVYRELLRDCPFAPDPPENNQAPFNQGLYSVTEMLVGGILELFEADIIRREVDGAAIHAGFFVECRDFYRRLRDMDPARRRRIAMMPVSYTNALYGGEPAKRAARRDARFINNAMIATCLGAIVSDGLDDGRVVSGVGGQFDFISQAFALEGARAIVTLNATRQKSGRRQSNIRWRYGHATVPSHFRDVVVSEYGVADLRGQTDEACVKRMLAISDSAFQDELLEQAKSAGKVAADFEIPPAWRRNTEDGLHDWLGDARRDGRAPPFPFGTDFSQTERRLLPVLEHLQRHGGSWPALLRLAYAGIRAAPSGAQERDMLERLQVLEASSLRERVYRWLLLGAMRERREAEPPDG